MLTVNDKSSLFRYWGESERLCGLAPLQEIKVQASRHITVKTDKEERDRNISNGKGSLGHWHVCYSWRHEGIYNCPLTVNAGEGSVGVVITWSAETVASKTLRVPCQTLSVVSASLPQPLWNMTQPERADCKPSSTSLKCDRITIWNLTQTQSEIRQTVWNTAGR